jgi:DNA-directed RNA polymerase sigma subunit (sigma70/sigma32)
MARNNKLFKQFDVSRERIRAIEEKALLRMKGPALGSVIIKRLD